MTAPATPAPADGFLTASDVALAAVLDKRAAALAPGERVSAHPFVRCPRCGQCDTGQAGEYPCPECGLPTVWDDDEILGSEDERKAVADALDYAANDYALVPSGDVRQTIIRAAALLRATAAPLPAPSASAGVGAETLEEWRKLADGLQRDACSDDGPAEARAWRAACAIRAAIDALSTAAAPVRPDRAAVEALVKTIRLGIPLPGCMTGPSEPCGECRSCKAWSACAALLAIVFGDSAPSEVDRGE